MSESEIKAYTLTKLAQMFDANRETMRRRLELVKPIGTGKGKRGGGDQFTLSQVLEAYTLYERQSLTGNEGKEALDAAYERARKDKELADKTALENQVRRGELLAAADVETEWSNIVAATRAAFLAQPSELAKELAVTTKPESVEEILTADVRERLEELSNEE